MGLSIHEYPIVPGSDTFTIDFALGVLDLTDVQVNVVGSLDGNGEPIDYAFTWVDEGTIRVTSLPASGIVRIIRTVSKETSPIEETSTQSLTRKAVSRAFRQVMMAVHEVYDGRSGLQTVVDRLLNREVYLEGVVDEAQGFADAAEVSATLSEQYKDIAVSGFTNESPYTTRAAAMAATVPAPVSRLLVALGDGTTLAYVRDAAGTALVTGGGETWSPDGAVYAEHFGAEGNDAGDYSAEIQAAIDWQASRASPAQGGTIHFRSAVYRASGLVYKPYVTLRGSGQFSTVLVPPPGANTSVLTVPDSSAGNGLYDLSIYGDHPNQTAGHGLYFEPTLANTGDAFFVNKLKGAAFPDTENAYKWFYASNISITGCKQSGIYNDGYGFAVRIHDFNLCYNEEHGLWAAGTDCEYFGGYVEKNGKAGVYVSTGAQKFADIKIHWSNRRRNNHGERWAGLHVETVAGGVVSSIQATNIESQSSYGDGFLISGEQSSFLGMVADLSGYTALGAEDTPDRISAHFVFKNCQDVSVIGHSIHNKDQVIGNGAPEWVTEWPYRLSGTNVFTVFNVSNDGKTNQPAPYRQTSFNDSLLGGINTFSVDNGDVFMDIAPKAPTPAGTEKIRFWRQVVGALQQLVFQVPGTASTRHLIQGTGLTQFNINDDGDLSVGSGTSGGAWNTSHLRLGSHHLWVDATGDLRIKSSTPTSATDGVVVGTQV